MDNENFAMQIVEKQLRRSEYHFYAVCVLFFVFMLFAYLWPVAGDVTQSVDNSKNVTQGINDDSSES